MGRREASVKKVLDYTKNIYYTKANDVVKCCKKTKKKTVIAPNTFNRVKGRLYYVKPIKDGFEVHSSPMASGGKKGAKKKKKVSKK